MLRSVCFKNFVKFKEKHSLNFQGSGPFIFIGENGSGKSSVLEGIRRCLHSDLSTSFSSPFQECEYSYFICKFETKSDGGEYMICGVVRPSKEKDVRYKFALTVQKDEVKEFCADLLVSLGNGEKCRQVQEISVKSWPLPGFIEEIFDNGEGIEDKFENFTRCAFADGKLEPVNLETQCQKLLGTLSDKIVFTLPLRSIGPLQWSKSNRIKSEMKDKNYYEAEERCEIIRYFLTDKDLYFDKQLEKKIFEEVTHSKKHNFTLTDLEDGKHILLNGDQYSLLKTPEGILEAKIFSILMSEKYVQTIILEEPERGMHPQFISRMVQIITRMKKRVILTTHNPSFITPWSFTDCFVFRHKDNKTCKIFSGSSIVNEKGSSLKDLRLLTSDHLSDILFSRRVLFCEGPSDYLFLTELKRAVLSGGDRKYRSLFQKLNYRQIEESLSEITLLSMGGAGNTPLCHHFCSRLDLKVQFLLDKDQEDKTQLAYLKSFIFFWPDGDLENMFINISSRDELLKTSLSEQNVNLEKKKSGNAVKLFLDPKVTVDNLQTSVHLILKHCKSTDSVALFMNFLCNNPIKD